MSFQIELEKLINKYSRESKSDTPDFILSNYMINCLKCYEDAVNQREKFFNYSPFSKNTTLEGNSNEK